MNVKLLQPSQSPSLGLFTVIFFLTVGCGRILIHCGVLLARFARYPIRPQSDFPLLDDTNRRCRFDIRALARSVRRLVYYGVNGKPQI